MVKEFHGKNYYVEVPNYQIVIEMIDYLWEDPILNDEFFGLTKTPDGTWVLYSDAKVGKFRNKKYAAWEKFKRFVYKLKKEDP